MKKESLLLRQSAEKALAKSEREELERYREIDKAENQKMPYYAPCIKCVHCGVILTPIRESILEYKKSGKETCENCRYIINESKEQERIATLEEASILSDAKILEAKRELLHKIRIEYGKMGGGYVFDDDFDDYLEDLDRIFELKQIKKKELEQHLKEAKSEPEVPIPPIDRNNESRMHRNQRGFGKEGEQAFLGKKA